MKYSNLGRSGLRVSELCLGTMTFGRETGEADSHRMLDHFVAAGGNFIDTADIYSDGASERILGNWLEGKDRESLVIATKVRFSSDLSPNRVGLSRKRIVAAIEQSLKNLKTDYVDLYQTHCWDSRTPFEETLATLDDLVTQGKVRYLGASNLNGAQLQRALDLQAANGWSSYVSLQPLYNLLDRTIEWELVDVCERNGLGVMPWSPLRGGWLSGKFHRGMTAPAAGSRIEKAGEQGWSETWAAYANDHTWGVLDAVDDIAKSKGASVSQVALAWLLSRPVVTAPILGVRTMEQLQNNLGAADVVLSAEDLARLTEVSDKPMPYPYDFIANAQKRL